MKKLLAVIMTFSMLIAALSVSIFAVNIELTTTQVTINNETMLLNTDALEAVTNITSEEAGYIAEFFVDDMILLDDCAWNESTEITRIVPLYNETATSPTAYSVELTSGYVVVSAFADATSLIPEYSDVEDPIYDNLLDINNGKIVYLGGYEYYVDFNKTTVKDLYGNTLKKNYSCELHRRKQRYM